MAINQKVLEEMLNQYPSKVKRNRKKHIIIKDSALARQEIEANTRTIPGIITNRGCAFAGCKGVVLGPLKDVIHIVHGPIGCAFYTWGARRNKAKSEDPTKNFINYCVSTDMQESDIVFGGEKKLARMIDEVMEIFKPNAITISATCPVGLIGDDLQAVAKAAQEKHGIPILAFNCEGYKGVSQSAGHHIANNGLMEGVIGQGDWEEAPGKYPINILGEYNIGGDSWEVERILKEIGYTVIAVMTGDGSYEELKNAHVAELNLVQCHRSINYIADMLETKYGTPWLKVNFIGVQDTIDSLRNMALYFGDPALIQKTEEVIARELARVEPILGQYKKICQGKTAFCFVGGSRGHHYQGLYAELGIETVLAGYEFAHRDDYEGRDVIPEIKLDADTKNIPDLHVTPDERRFRLKISPERMEELKKKIPLSNYKGMNIEMKDGSIIVDDLNHFETEEFIRLLKPDIFSSGIKDKYVVQKMGIPSKQLHSYDYSGPYAGFNGAVNFARDIAMAFTSPTWNFITPPWKNEPLLEGIIAEGGCSKC
ncbi:nitrogenase molybdenum-iron protein alpha chain [Desulforamulus hydrothermalis]|uniref:Nitrogenase protein alpha chain n=1 Tax=Desulforamulus hydrothermalis Lam5 = DSM 18033 TaxID=1121428 RepID=K8DXQ8_9FIRM|nr:nitrogenase molybdenum-iron protein alpha chain [Desulforamulus hydrothermalis]CCO07502.1 Nitrogenase molybdenum-iron protein alpha chain [Desulforamulus hydrothermalis Lam5 = DSM 18033]SHH17052.1 Mo-nitrogenase MoFe protein subunit NifD precursor [Desulforamulus hydrothermalis Lam5 = DSM 18033]